MSFINSIIKAFVGDKSQKDVKATQPYITKIKALEPILATLSHDELRAKTVEFKEKIKQARAKQDAEIEAKRAEIKRLSEERKAELQVLESKKSENEVLSKKIETQKKEVEAIFE